MCGIVGLFLKDPGLEPELGVHLSRMLETMTERGPDSAGFAVYTGSEQKKIKLTLRGTDPDRLDRFLGQVRTELSSGCSITVRSTHAVITLAPEDEQTIRRLVQQSSGAARIVSTGRAMEIYKEVGLPRQVAGRFALESMKGSHGIGHTRMATESAVTTDGAHPFSTAQDQCLVHNGSLSNHNSLRRMLNREGLMTETENDTEVAAAYLSWRLREGDTLNEALEECLEALDGFYTFVVGTEKGFAVLRDPIACKPAVMAETDQYVAFGSEYRTLAVLPGIDQAHVFEPEPAKVYVWEHA